MEVKYLNTDLEIESKNDLSKIVEEFGEDVLVLHHGEIRGYQHASFEIAGGSTDADASINSFCTLIEGLPREVREIWDQCVSRIRFRLRGWSHRYKTFGQPSKPLLFNESPKSMLVL
jgi:hypothetical protein